MTVPLVHVKFIVRSADQQWFLQAVSPDTLLQAFKVFRAFPWMADWNNKPVNCYLLDLGLEMTIFIFRTLANTLYSVVNYFTFTNHLYIPLLKL